MTPVVDIFTDPVNLSALISLIFKTISMSIIAFYILPSQVRDIITHVRIDDGLQRLRYFILGFLIAFLTFSVPPFVYQAYKIAGYNYGLLNNVASISSNLSLLAVTVWLVLLYTYKRPR